MKKILVLLFLIIGLVAKAQEKNIVSGTVLNSSTNKPLENVHVVNLNLVKGEVSDENGFFEIEAEANDTLYFSYMGFKSIEVRVTNDWILYGDVKVKMTEIGIALEQVVVRPVQLTGYLEIDSKNIPIFQNYQYSISGLSSSYEGGESQPGAVSKVLGAIFNPADFLYNIFGKRPKQMQKLRKMKDDDQIRALLQTKYDRRTLMALLQVDRLDIDEILMNCNFSKDFIENANDLQILDAISGCYEEYKVLDQK
ncbi:MAG TPA: carboxypeptidase-like regulatory domain-containing protein [Salinimicrobium sp.]|nr:carboxypeptidase-like regulatory domain-containing protein [Salinimicrobium sp.]